MLIIRKEQMDLFRAAMRKRFETRMVEHIRQTFPERTRDVSDERIYNAVQESMRKAESFGIELEDDIRRFIEYLVIYGTQLDIKEDIRWLGEILRREDLNGTEKMDMIDDLELKFVRDQQCLD